MSNEDKIVMPAKKLRYLQPGQTSLVKVSPKAYDALVDLANESGLPLSRVASVIIEQATEKNLIQMERNETDEQD